MSTPITFKRAICRSANEVQSKADKNILVLIALNYAYEIEKDTSLGESAVAEYYEFLKDSLYSTSDVTENVVKSADIQFPAEVSVRQSSLRSSTRLERSLVDEIRENPAPTSTSIDEHTEKYTDAEASSRPTLDKKYSALADYDWNAALSSSGSPGEGRRDESSESPVVSESQGDVVDDTHGQSESTSENVVRKVSEGTRKVSPIPDEILYGDLSKYGIPNVERIKLISQIGDISSGTTGGYDQVYDIGFVPRTFRLGNRDVIQHVNNEDDSVDSSGSITPATQVNSEVSIEDEVQEDMPKVDDVYTPVDVQEDQVQEEHGDVSSIEESEVEIHGEDVER